MILVIALLFGALGCAFAYVFMEGWARHLSQGLLAGLMALTGYDLLTGGDGERYGNMVWQAYFVIGASYMVWSWFSSDKETEGSPDATPPDGGGGGAGRGGEGGGPSAG